MHIDGACHCGSISFSAEIDPARVVVCHCSDCQILSGSAFRMSVVTLIECLTARGEPRRYVKTADSGAKRAQLVPTAQIWTRSAMPWLAQLDEIPGAPDQQAKPTL